MQYLTRSPLIRPAATFSLREKEMAANLNGRIKLMITQRRNERDGKP